MLLKKRGYSRKYKFIDKKQQARFAVDIALHSLLFPTFFLILNILPPMSTVLLGPDEVRVRPIMKGFFQIAAQHWIVMVIALGFVSFFSVLFSHRIFGPMRRFEIALRQRLENPNEIIHCQLRTGDYFHGFSSLLEEVLNKKIEAGNSEASSPKNDQPLS